jgi:hypothetical protein
MNNSIRVSPDEWRVYRENHEFLNPCCLCPLFEPQGKDSLYTEAAIYLPLSGQCQGEWVAECAKGRCGYLGRLSFPSIDLGDLTPRCLVLLERLYRKLGLPVKMYPKRSRSLISQGAGAEVLTRKRRHDLPGAPSTMPPPHRGRIRV